MAKISIVVPCYNEEKAIPYFYEEICKVAGEMPEDVSLEILFVNDGSKDRTGQVLQELRARNRRELEHYRASFAEKHNTTAMERLKNLMIKEGALPDGCRMPKVEYICFSRNFGKEAAMYAGISNARGDYVAIMDADLQDPPSLLPVMYRALTEEGYDSAATRRVTRKGEPPIRSFFARRFYRVMNRISDVELMDGARDYRLMNRKYVDALLSLEEVNRFSKGLFGWVGFKTKWIEFENVERVAGETKWSFWGLFKYSLDGIVAFSEAPLYISSVLGASMCGVSFLAIIFIIIRQLLFHNSAFGWPSMVCIIMLIGGIQLLSIGILGLYFSKTYLEVKRRPIYIASENTLEED